MYKLPDVQEKSPRARAQIACSQQRAGRRALMERGDNEVGPYQSPMEDGMQHFHEWYRQTMGAHLPQR